MDDVRIKVRLERLEVGPSPASEELVLQMPEDLLGRAVVDAVALPRHTLHYAGPLEPPRPRRVLVLPAYVAVEYRSGPLGHLRRHGHHRTQHARCFGMQGKPTMSYRDL